MSPVLQRVADLLSPSGLIVRGAFNFRKGETVPEMPGRGPARSVILIGHGGGGFWPVFKDWLNGGRSVPGNPLDGWSRQIIDSVAADCGVHAVYPTDVPYHPFQQWAMRAENLRPSPLGILMHPEFGLWHAYRGALLLDRDFDFAPVEKAIHLCDACDGKPCLNSCPAGAFMPSGYAVGDCRAHVTSADGSECRTGGCIARNACPHGTGYRYSRDQQRFHMAAFLRRRT